MTAQTWAVVGIVTVIVVVGVVEGLVWAARRRRSLPLAPPDKSTARPAFDATRDARRAEREWRGGRKP